MRWVLGLVIIGLVAFAAYVRLAPPNPAVWHKGSYPSEPGDRNPRGGYAITRQITTTPEGILEALDRVALATPRTRRIAGSVAEGMITYETRTALWGFPDYTTAEITTSISGVGPLLQISGRQRFGLEDLGVNAARIKDWLAQLGPLIVAPE